MDSTKKSLTLSVIVLLTCVSLFVGTTYAWLTATKQSDNNVIQAGNLDVAIEYKNADETDFESLDTTTNVFKAGTYWEPGHVEYAVIKVSNKGTIAFKYTLGAYVASEVTGNLYDGTGPYKLSDLLKYSVISGDVTAAEGYAAAEDKRAFVLNKAGSGTALSTAYSESGTMKKGDEATLVTLVVWMPSTETANYKTPTGTDQIPQIKLGISLVAAQLTQESDSFGTDYDAASPWTGGYNEDELTANTDTSAKTVKIETAEQLAAFAKAVNGGTTYSGYTVTLENDIDLNNVPWTPINAGNWGMTFDGNGKTIMNLNVTGEKNVGLFGTFTGNTMKDLTVDGAVVTGINHVAALSGDGQCAHFDKCTVKNATITSNVKNHDDGDKAGAITGYLTAQPSASVTNCTVENCTIQGYRDVGSVVGYAQFDGCTVTGNTASNVKLINDRSDNYKGYTTDEEYHVNDIVGENDEAVVSDNTATDITKETK